MGNKWNKSDINVAIRENEAFAPSWHQGLHPGVEEIGIKCL
jgi:hypothetical protein